MRSGGMELKMAKLSSQKLKLLYLMKILLEQTDEEHTITVPGMIDELSKLGIRAERKSIYNDLEYLKMYGLDICCRKSKTYDYYVASRDFELPELKLLADSVAASKFITHKKSMSLVSKISKLTSNGNAGKIKRQVFVTNRVKTVNEQIFYNVDKIHEAISENKKISFRYFEWTVDKEKRYRKNGERYIETPISLTWDDENYYLITYKKKYNSFVHYRVDKMDNIEKTGEAREMPAEDFDPASYSKQVFSMYGGKEEDVSIECKNELAGVVFDRFGMDVPVVKKDNEHFITRVKVAVSPQFLGWVISLGNRARIVSPQQVVEKMKDFINTSRAMYK